MCSQDFLLTTLLEASRFLSLLIFIFSTHSTLRVQFWATRGVPNLHLTVIVDGEYTVQTSILKDQLSVAFLTPHCLVQGVVCDGPIVLLSQDAPLRNQWDQQSSVTLEIFDNLDENELFSSLIGEVHRYTSLRSSVHKSHYVL